MNETEYEKYWTVAKPNNVADRLKRAIEILESGRTKLAHDQLKKMLTDLREGRFP